MIRVISVTLLWLFFIQTAIAQDITPIEKLVPGMSATIQGTETRILDEDEFRIEDLTGSVRVSIGWQNRMVVPVGEEIIVRGVVDDDLKTSFRPELYAFEITRQDGTVIKLNQQDE